MTQPCPLFANFEEILKNKLLKYDIDKVMEAYKCIVIEILVKL